MFVHMMDQEELQKGDGPIGLVLAPTRELCVQIYHEAKKFAKAYSIEVTAIYGGASKTNQFKELRKGFTEIIVATPGRLIDLIKMKATNLKRVSYVVLDEADRMFDLGFERWERRTLM
jgi:ATP-dependent RNA helicase DDX42